MRPSLLQSPAAEPFTVDDFLARIADKEGVAPATAEAHARALLSAVADAAPKGELLDTLEQLPREIREFFGQQKKAA